MASNDVNDGKFCYQEEPADFSKAADDDTAAKHSRESKKPPGFLEVILHIQLPDMIVRTAQRKTKSTKREPIVKGPKDFSLNAEWPEFLASLAELAGVRIESVLTDTIQWKWVKPKNSQLSPLCDTDGLRSLMRQVQSRNKDWVVLVEMKRPKTMAIPADDDDENTEDESGHKKMKTADDRIESVVEELLLLHSPGKCATHPEIACFHNMKSDLHFKLERKELLVWAAAIVAGNASLTKAPIGSPFFTPNRALKKVCSRSPVTTESGPSTDYPPAPLFFPSSHARGSTGTLQFSGAGFHHPWSLFLTRPLPPPESASFAFSPSSITNEIIIDLDAPSLVQISIKDFCILYGLNESIETGLNKIGFYIGCDMKFFTNTQLTTAGLRPGDWEQVYRAYEKYKHINKAAV